MESERSLCSEASLCVSFCATTARGSWMSFALFKKRRSKQLSCVGQMEETNIDDVRDKARLWQAQGKSWHFHMLTPTCALNPRKDRFAFVLENGTDHRSYVVYSEREHTQAGQELVRMLHGDNILDREEARTGGGGEKIQEILRRIEDLNDRRIPWHHHMLFPDCIFNRHEGKWNILFEDTEREDIVELLYDQEPVDDLRKIEVLYYKEI